MFDSLFKNAEEDTGKPTSVLSDVEWILDNTNYILLRAAWDEFLHILATDKGRYDEDLSHDNLEGIAMDSWYGLKKLKDFGGDFTQFNVFELHYLERLQGGFIVYDEIMHVLSDHHNDEKEANYFFQSHPEIHKHVPKEFDNPKQILEVLLETARVYRWELEQFSKKHSEKIDKSIKIILEEHLKQIKSKK
jgi:hypothetical protein